MIGYAVEAGAGNSISANHAGDACVVQGISVGETYDDLFVNQRSLISEIETAQR
jgi:hypothetical protein